MAQITWPKYEREGQRYASDLTDAEWALIEPQMPAANRIPSAFSVNKHEDYNVIREPSIKVTARNTTTIADQKPTAVNCR